MEEQQKPRQWGAFIIAGVGALVVLVLFVIILSGTPSKPAPLPATPIPTAVGDPAVVVVNGQPVGQSVWIQMVLMDRVMSGLAGVPAPDSQETLDTLINEVLLLQSAPPAATPTADEVEAQIAVLEGQWGRSDEEVTAALVAEGLDRAALVQAMTRFMTVQRAKEGLEAEGNNVEEWVARQQEEAAIEIYQGPMDSAFIPPTPLAPSPPPLASQAPDWTLDKAGGGTLTLSEQLTQGPVVLVFFEHCG